MLDAVRWGSCCWLSIEAMQRAALFLVRQPFHNVGIIHAQAGSNFYSHAPCKRMHDALKCMHYVLEHM